MKIIGIDAGLTGYFATLDEHGRYLTHWKTPIVEHVKKTKKRATGKISTKTNATLDVPAICQYLNGSLMEYGQVHAFIERQFPLPGQGLGSTAKTLFNFGVLVGVLAGFGIPTTIVNARDWQAATLPADAADTKLASVAAVKAWDDGIDLRRTPRARTDDHNLCDAILIARFGFMSAQENAAG